LESVHACLFFSIPKELLPRHNWFLLTLYGQPYDQKPPLPFWILEGLPKTSRNER
jgi:4-amino-4-deoxy-L-arabinose transferase-like glycosyltransferase